jgi:hypothetical protein
MLAAVAPPTEQGVAAMRVSFAVLAAWALAAGATALALMIHRTHIICAHLVAQPGSACPGQSADYPLHLRVGIIAAGLIIASLIVILGVVRPHNLSSRLSQAS